MGIEIERRFLVTGNDWRSLAGSAHYLRQGYLCADKEGFTVRVRIDGNEKAWLTLKSPAEGISRNEFEYLIPLKDAEDLWSLALHRLTKIRYELSLGGGDWIIDCFQGDNSPLVLAEVELPFAEKPIVLPSWCTAEVTGQSCWNNAALASFPIAGWPSKIRHQYGF